MNTEAQLEANWNHEAPAAPSPSEPLPSTQGTIPVCSTHQTLLANSPAQDYSPVAIILATCALVTAIGQVLRRKN